MLSSLPRRLSFLGLVVLVGGACLLPWLKHRHYLRDTYDYGLVLAANGRMDAGEKPYVDFTTPIQAGFLRINHLMEKLGGGDYAALTLGGAALIVLATAALCGILARRWSVGAALAVGASVVIMSATQHTILWHNSLGVVTLALVAWASACAPVWRRETWGWHVVMSAGLFLGGINKLNFHLIGVAVALAWALRAGLVRSSGWGRVLASMAGMLVLGLVLPVAAELGWTGASWAQWWHNVVELAAGSRSELLWQIWSVDFLLKPIHNYYGELLLGQVGLIGLGFTVVTLFAGWRHRAKSQADATARLDRVLGLLASGLAGLAGAALLMTNYDVAYLGLGAWLVLAVSVWLGFSLPAGARWFRVGLLLPVVGCAAAAWWSAWVGQRSQFGFSTAPREAYVAAETVGPQFAGLRGLRLPPELVESLRLLARVMPVEQADGSYPVFYGKGLEFLHRYSPAINWRGMPLWCHFGTSYGPQEVEVLNDRLINDTELNAVFVLQAYDHWPQPLRTSLQQHFKPELVGPVVVRWQRRNADLLNLQDSLQSALQLGGNMDYRLLHLDQYPLKTVRGSNGRVLLATTQSVGQVMVRAPVQRLRGVFVVDRRQAPADTVVKAEAKLIVHGSAPEDIRWIAQVELPAGQQVVEVPFEADLGGRAPQFWINRGDRVRGAVAGFRDFEITPVLEATDEAPALRDDLLAESPDVPALANSLLGSLGWRPDAIVVRGGQVHPDGLMLVPGAEAWLHTGQRSGEVRGELLATDPDASALVRTVWYKNGRLQIIHQARVSGRQPINFHGVAAEPGGWIGVLVSPEDSRTSVRVRVTNGSFLP